MRVPNQIDNLLAIAQTLEQAERAETVEGYQYIVLSDDLAKRWAETIRQSFERVNKAGVNSEECPDCGGVIGQCEGQDNGC